MRTFLLLLGWAATVAVAFYAGTTLGADGAGSTPDPHVSEAPLPERPAASDAGVVLAPGASTAHTVGREAGPALAVPPELPGASPSGGEILALEPFTLEGVTEPDEAMGRVMRHVAALLAKGKKGHLDLLRFLDEHVVENDDLERLLGSEAGLARFIYPWVEFTVHRKDQVVDLVETVYETIAANPAFFDGFDDNTLEIFTEGASMVLPGAIDEQRLATFRAHARAILERPEEGLPEVVRAERRHIEQALAAWAPRVSADEALEKLHSGELKGAEAVEVLRRLPPERLEGLDLGAILAPAVRTGDYRTLRALGHLPLEQRDVDLLDRSLLEAVEKGSINSWHVQQYLRSTKRDAWPSPKTLVEQGLARGGAAANVSADVLVRLDPRPPTDYVRWVIDTYDLHEAMIVRLKAVFRLE